jgi:hypothetical protein
LYLVALLPLAGVIRAPVSYRTSYHNIGLYWHNGDKLIIVQGGVETDDQDDTFPFTSCTWTSTPSGGATGNTNSSGASLSDVLTLSAGSSVTYTVSCPTSGLATGVVLTNTASLGLLTTSLEAVDKTILVPEIVSGPPLTVGSELQVNTHTTDAQRRPSVANAPDGSYVIVWHSFGQDGDNFGVFGQRYDASGSVVGDEFQVNTYTTANQGIPSVVSLPGGFVVVWRSLGNQDGVAIASRANALTRREAPPVVNSRSTPSPPAIRITHGSAALRTAVSRSFGHRISKTAAARVSKPSSTIPPEARWAATFKSIPSRREIRSREISRWRPTAA